MSVRTTSDTYVEYEPRGAAVQLWQCKATEILMEGPAGTGKTRAILEKVLALADKYPNSRHLICRKTRAAMTESVLVTFEEKVLPPGHPMKLGPSREQRRSYKLSNGSQIVVGGLDHPERTFSTEYDTVSVFEATEATENDWESLHRALRNGRMGYHQAIADCNPGAPTHWLNQRANRNAMVRLLSRHEDNPQFWDAYTKKWTPEGVEYIARLDALTGHRKLRLRYGKWAAAEGVVYSEFDAAVHLIDAMPDGWHRWTRRFRSIDFGYTNPFVCLWGVLDPDGRLYIYREIYHTRKLVEDHARDIRQRSSGERYESTVADHDAEDRATLDRHGISTVPAHKAITPGIEAVQARLRAAGDGKPRLFILRDALVELDEHLIESKLPVRTAEEFDAYIYPQASAGKAAKELPIDANNHGMDALRYMVAAIDGLGSSKPWNPEDVKKLFGLHR